MDLDETSRQGTDKRIPLEVEFAEDSPCRIINDLNLRGVSVSVISTQERISQFMIDSLDELYSDFLHQLKFQRHMNPKAGPVADWIISCSQTIYYEVQRDYPLKSLHQATSARKALENLNALLGNLDNLPSNLTDYLPSDIPTIEELISEDMALTKCFAIKASNLIRKQLHIFEDIMSRLNKKRQSRPTRSQTKLIESILEGKALIPVEMYDEYEPSSFHLHDNESIISSKPASPVYDEIIDTQIHPEESATQNGKLIKDKPDIKSSHTSKDLLELDSVTNSTYVDAHNFSNSTYSKLTPINEENLPFSKNEQIYIIKVCKELVPDEMEDVSSFISAIEVLESRLGVQLDPYNPNLLKQIQDIKKTQRFFEVLLDDDPVYNHDEQFVSYQNDEVLKGHKGFDNLDRPLSISSNMSLTPPLQDIQGEPNLLEKSANQSMSPNFNTNCDKPLHKDIIRVRTTSPFDTSLTETRMPDYLGPQMTLETTKQDLERHQRAFLDPPVRSKHSQSSQFDEKVLQNIPNEEQKQILGEEIFPFIYDEYPKLAKKLTGMILELPNQELIRCINSPQVLSEYLNNAVKTLSDFAIDTRDIELVEMLQEPKIDNHRLDNDEQAAMFQPSLNQPTRNPNLVINQTYSVNDSHRKLSHTGSLWHDQIQPKLKTPNTFYDQKNHANHYTGHSVNQHLSSKTKLVWSGYKTPVSSFKDGSSINSLNNHNNLHNDWMHFSPNHLLNHASSHKSPRYHYQTHTQIGSIYGSRPPRNFEYYTKDSHLPKPSSYDLCFKGDTNDTPTTAQCNDHQIGTGNHLSYPFHDDSKDRYRSARNVSTKTHLNHHQRDVQNNIPEQVELVLRQKRELDATTFLAKRIIKGLSNVSNMSAQRLTDLLNDMKDNNKTLVDLECKLSKFLKCLVSNKNAFLQYDPSLYQKLKDDTKSIEDLSTLFQNKLDLADSIIHQEDITKSQITSADSKDLSCLTFNGERGLQDPHLFQFLSNLEEYFKICRTPDNLKAQILKKRITGSASLCIPQDLNDYTQIVTILLDKFGSTVIIHNNILELHKSIGTIPSKLCVAPKWERIESTTRSHLILIRKAEALSINKTSNDQIFSNANRNYALLNLLPHENKDELRKYQNTVSDKSLYKMIVHKFEDVLSTASNNIDHTEASKSRKDNLDNKKKHDKVDINEYALAFKEKPTMITGTCAPKDCHLCVLFQKNGVGNNYFEHHILVGETKRVYPNHCPLYLSLSMEERNEFVKKNNLCRYCLRLKAQCHNKACGDDHLIPSLNGRQKGYTCSEPSCKERLELCITHKDMNMGKLAAKHYFYNRFQIDMCINAFTASFDSELQTPVLNLQCDSNHKINFSSKQATNPAFHELLTHDNSIINPDNHASIESSLMLASRAPPNSTNSKIESDESSRPLLVDSSEKLLGKNTALLAENAKSIFLYSQIKGISKNISIVFDSGGGSSLIKSNIPGYELYACRNNKKISLRGIGNGRIEGQEYTVLLPLLKGKVAIQAFAVDKILEPLTTVDLQPALEYFKVNALEDDTITKKSKQEIENAKIFRYVTGEVDILLGIKHLRIFPKLVHSLSSGLSIFKMVLKPASTTALYCLGGPFECLRSLQAMFHDIGPQSMLDHINEGLEQWRGPSSSIITDHLRINSSLSHADNKNTDDVFLNDSYIPEDNHDELVLVLEDVTSPEHKDLPKNDPNKGLFNSFSQTYNWIQKHYDVPSIEPKNAKPNMPCLTDSSTTNSQSDDHESLDQDDDDSALELIVAFQCDDKLTSDLIDFQQSLAKDYPEVEQGLVPAIKANIPLCNIKVPCDKDIHKAAIVFHQAWEKWLHLHRIWTSNTPNKGLNISLKGIALDEQTLNLKPLIGKHMLESISSLFNEMFEDQGFMCTSQQTPMLTVCNLDENNKNLALDIANKHSNTYVGCSKVYMIKLLSPEEYVLRDHLLVYKSLTFDPDRTSPYWGLLDEPTNSSIESNSLETKSVLDSFKGPSTYMKPSHSTSCIGKKELDKGTICPQNTPTKVNLFYDRNKSIQSTSTYSENSTTLLASPSKEMIMVSKEDNPNITSTQDAECHKGSMLTEDETKQRKAKRKPPPKSLLACIKDILDSSHVDPRCENCFNCKTCKSLALKAMTNLGPREHMDDELIKSSVFFDKKEQKFCCPLPFIEDPATSLAPNIDQAKSVYKKIVKSLKDKPDDKSAIIKSFSKLVDLGYVEPLKNMSKELQQEIQSKQLHFIPWNVVYKDTSVSTPCRIVFNGSSRTKSGKSINDILCKGVPQLNLLPLALILVKDPILLTMDIQKFYNSCSIPTYHYHLQCILWQHDLDPMEPPEIYILKTHTYGLTSSSRVLEVCLEKIAKMYSWNDQFHSLLMNKTYVDDAFGNCSSHEEAINLMNFCEKVLPKHGFFIKGYTQSYCNPPDNIAEYIDGQKIVMAIGMIWDPKNDLLRLRVPPLDFSGNKVRGKLECPVVFEGTSAAELNEFVPQQLTLRMVASKVATIWDVNGFTQPWMLGVKHILRLSCQAVNRIWDEPLPTHLRNMWIHKFYEFTKLGKISFPRCTFPLNHKYSELIIVACSDMGNIGKLQCFYSLKKIADKCYHPQLVYSKSQLTSNKSVPCEELDSMSNAATTLEKICDALGNVDRRVLCTDSTVAGLWTLRDPFTLAAYQRVRTQNIRKRVDTSNIFHIRSEWNPADCGTKKPESISIIEPGSFFNAGPAIFTLGIDACVANNCLKPISELTIDPSLKKITLDGILIEAIPKIPIMEEDDLTETDDSDKIVSSFMQDGISCELGVHSKRNHIQAFPNEFTNLLNTSSSDSSRHDNNQLNVFAANNIKDYPDDLMNSEKVCSAITDEAVGSFTTNYTKKVSERFSFHEYLVNPLNRTWTSSVRIMAIIYHFLRKLIYKLYLKDRLTNITWSRLLKDLFPPTLDDLSESSSYLCVFEEQDEGDPGSHKDSYNLLDTQVRPTKRSKKALRPRDLFDNIDLFKSAKQAAVTYFLTLASKELESFYSKSMLKKHTTKKGNMFYSKHRHLEASNVSNLMDDQIELRELGIQTDLPCSDKYSPVGIAILTHFHRKIANHQGVDRTWIKTLSSIYVFQGQSLLTDIIKGCTLCRYKLKERYKSQYGPINKQSLTFSSVNRAVMLDLSGPYYIKSRKRPTRSHTGSEKVYLLHSVCLTSFLNTIIPVEDYGAEAFTNALHRLGSIYGFPQIAYTDASKAQLKGLLTLETPLQTRFNTIYEETNIEIRICGTGSQSHSKNGRVEKSIHLFQKYLENRQKEINGLSIYQLETLVSQACSFLNSIPLCHKQRYRGSVSSSLISPYSFLLGRRSNDRAPAGSPTLSENRGVILEGVANASKGMYNYFVSSIPDLLLRPSNFDDPKHDIDKGDLVLFPFQDGTLVTNYKLGLVIDLERSSDRQPRIIEVAYVNHSETNLPTNPDDREKLKQLCSFKRFTRKGIHTLCKIYSVDDPCINKDLEEVNETFRSHKPFPDLEEIGLLYESALPEPHPVLVGAQMSYIID